MHPWGTLVKLLILVTLVVSSVSFGQEVIDLGKVLIQGKMRGPEVQVIESDRMGHEAAGQFMQFQLRNMEKELLRHEPPTTETKQ